MRLLLDTVVFIRSLLSPERLSKKAIAAIQKEDNVRELSAISVTEIAIKRGLGKLSLDEQAVQAGIADLKVRLLPYTGLHAFKLFSLPLMHADHFDRQLIAQALVEEISIVTCDEAFSRYKGLKVIW